MSFVNTIIQPSAHLTDSKTWILLTNRSQGAFSGILVHTGYYFGHCQSLSVSLSSLSDTMRSSTLYGPVTKVTAGKYFVQGANKGLIRWRRKGVKYRTAERKKEVRTKKVKNLNKVWRMEWLVILLLDPPLSISYHCFSLSLSLSCTLHHCIYCYAVSCTLPQKHYVLYSTELFQHTKGKWRNLAGEQLVYL